MKNRSGTARREAKPLASPSWTVERLDKLSKKAVVTLQKNAEQRDNVELTLLCSEALAAVRRYKNTPREPRGPEGVKVKPII
jgi:hypothetical protein